MEFQDLELAKAADIIARDLLCLKSGRGLCYCRG
ncbi:hypothetical protein ES703_94655 [subsurface metagenome]